MSKKKETTVQEKPVYNPGKNYSWKPEDQFTFTGEEFGIVNKVLQDFINGDATSVQNIIKITQLYSLVQQKLAYYVSEGVVVEQTKEEDK